MLEQPSVTVRPFAGRSLWLVLLLSRVALSMDITFKVSGHVHGASGKHPVYVALWNREGFLTRPAHSFRFEGKDPAFSFNVPRGQWAISTFEDVNENGVLDQGVFGPKEPSGFWRPFHGWHKPSFDEVASPIEADTPNADVTLK